ncbi:MAG: 3D-(3,5/4)-trihydroxycyclohexane-1,2-dione acylhydrolase (decyclizing) [Enterobacteriaceae bacterium]
MMKTERLTMAQALVKYLSVQQVEIEGQCVPLFAGVFAIFGHGNVAGLGEALYHQQDRLPTWRAHNEQAMAHAAIAFAKTHRRQRMMAVTTSIGPGAANMVTAAALAHVNRLPVLLLPGDIFAGREPDPVLQQLEREEDATVSVNDCFRPVSRFFDRIMRPEQLLKSLPQAMRILTDPQACGPVTLALPQDVQTMAYDFPVEFFTPRVHRLRRMGADEQELQQAISLLQQARKPLVIAGGGVHYSGATEVLRQFVEHSGLPVGETQAGKGALPWDHPCNMGSIGVTGAEAANRLAQEADVILVVGSRLQDFTTGSWSLFRDDARLIGLNINGFDAGKHRAIPLVADARRTLLHLQQTLAEWKSPATWRESAHELQQAWWLSQQQVTAAPTGDSLPTDAQVIGAVNRSAQKPDIVVCAAGGLPGELHKLWRTESERGYHVEYGFSCMGYEIAGGLGVKMAVPESQVYVMVGDGSYLMMNSEIATSVMLGMKLIIVVLDNRGFACINRLQHACGGAGFNNLLQDCHTAEAGAPKIDFAAHARALGAESEYVKGIAELESALQRARGAQKTTVIAIDTEPVINTEAGGHWWDVAVPEVSQREQVQQARERYLQAKQQQKWG